MVSITLSSIISVIIGSKIIIMISNKALVIISQDLKPVNKMKVYTKKKKKQGQSETYILFPPSMIEIYEKIGYNEKTLTIFTTTSSIDI